MMSFGLKCPDLHWCLAKPTDFVSFVASQPIIKFMHFHGQFLFKKLPLADKKYFVEPWQGCQGSRTPGPHLGHQLHLVYLGEMNLLRRDLPVLETGVVDFTG